MSAIGADGGSPRALDPNTALAAEIRAELARHKISARALSRHTGWARETARKIVAGESDIDTERLFAIADIVGVPPEDMVRAARMKSTGPQRPSH